MKAKCLVETTPGFPPHCYLVTDRNTKLIAYRKCSDGSIKTFKGSKGDGLRFDTRYRKFKEIVDKELLKSVGA